MNDLTAALRRYRAQHDEGCAFLRSIGGYQAGPCDCGLDALLSSASEQETQKIEERITNNELGAALLPVDPSASPATTETLPTRVPRCPQCKNTTTISQLLQYGACCFCSEDAPYLSSSEQAGEQ